MLTNVPVYSTQNNTHFVNIYTESDDGTFRRTQNEPLRLLRDDISGISMPQGELVSQHYDRHDRSWMSATVTYHYGRPQSFYQFLREKVAQNKFFVFSKPTLSGHLFKFDVHELKFKPSMSQRKMAILKEKYLEALSLWSKEEYATKKVQEEQARNARMQHEKTQKIKLVKVHPQAHQRRVDNSQGQQRQGQLRQDKQRRSSDKANPAVYNSGGSDKVVAFNNFVDSQNSIEYEPPLRQRHSDAAPHSEQSPGTPSTKESLSQPDEAPKEKNSFTGKRSIRHSHFLRRFLFQDN